MNKKSMTALISAFARVWHYRNYQERIFSDSIGGLLLSDDEYESISTHMKKGIRFFNPDFTGNEDEALKWIMTHQLSPTPLGRGAYAERKLENASMLGATQYLMIASGYDTFAYRQPLYGNQLEIFEIDHPLIIEDKLNRLQNAAVTIPGNVHFIGVDLLEEEWESSIVNNPLFDQDQTSLCSLLGLIYYLDNEAFESLIARLTTILTSGSSIVFDYPDQNTFTEMADGSVKRQVEMAKAAGEPMLGSYSEETMQEILSRHGFLIYEHLCPEDITSQYFERFNNLNDGEKMKAFENVNYCLAVKQ